MFAATVSEGISVKCWKTMPMPARIASLGEYHPPLAVDPDLTRIGLMQTIENMHQRRLPGAVLAQKCMDLSGTHREVHLVAGGNARKAFSGASQFGYRRGSLIRVPGSSNMD